MISFHFWMKTCQGQTLILRSFKEHRTYDAPVGGSIIARSVLKPWSQRLTLQLITSQLFSEGAGVRGTCDFPSQSFMTLNSSVLGVMMQLLDDIY